MKNGYIDLGKGKWRRKWISKRLLIEYISRRYRVSLSMSEGISISELKETALLQLLMEKGLQFEAGVVDEVKPQKLNTKEAIEPHEPLAKRTLLIQSPKIFRNRDLGIQGIPDLINTDKGRFLPIEIKSHSKVTRTDKLELAFYWLLLSPFGK